MYSVDIDTGGTMTDALVSGGDQPLAVKVETTPHDVTVAFMACLESAQNSLGFDSLAAFLDEVDVIRWSSTITSNVLAQRSGPKLGLIVSKGNEDDLYAGDNSQTEALIPSLIRREHIIGLSADADRREVATALKALFDCGIRRVSVSLRGAFPNGEKEQEVLGIIAEQFPDHFLGSIPALAGSEMLMRDDDMSRTFIALINSYVHNSLARSLFRAEDQVKLEHGFKGNILVGHLNGGVARIGKTKAVDTIESGPLFGTHACAHVATKRKISRVLAIDIGGTTAKASAIENDRPVMRSEGSLFGIPVRMPMPVLRSIALGGGSVARVADGQVKLGPESQGAAPGPAAYGLGGEKATLTDALVVLGLLSPTSFLGGRRKLDAGKAEAAIAEQIAKPLGVDVATAAVRIRERAVAMMADLARDTLKEVGWSEVPVMFAYGGNGPLFATAIAGALGIPEVALFRLGAIFSAYGGAISDVLHVYERAIVSDNASKEIAFSADLLKSQAERDLEGEGFDPAAATYQFILEGKDGSRAEGADASTLSVAHPQLLRLEARHRLGGFELPQEEAMKARPADHRSSPIGDKGQLAVIDYANLRGATLDGPVIVDGGNFTWHIEAGWALDVDTAGDGNVRRKD